MTALEIYPLLTHENQERLSLIAAQAITSELVGQDKPSDQAST